MSDTIDPSNPLQGSTIPTPPEENAPVGRSSWDGSVTTLPALICWCSEQCALVWEGLALPATFILPATLVDSTTQNGFLNGDSLTKVTQTLQSNDFWFEGKEHDVSGYKPVDPNSAIVQGLVNAGVGARDFHSYPHGHVKLSHSGGAMFGY
jgi:hypothetical protein